MNAPVKYDLAYLMARIVVTEAGCWEWSLCKDGCGYGTVGGRYTPSSSAHRLSWILHNGPIPDGLLVLHRCDNPPCCNPDHLFLGTDADNARDREAKKRGNQPKGERHGMAKLTRQQAMEIKTRTDKGCLRLAREYGVSEPTVTAIRRGDKWKCLGAT